jgi:TetR/AcrR family transcriptional regulator
MKLATGSPRRLKRDSTRQQILESAARGFARAGFEASSMADIAGQAGLKKALVQYHFETKEKLWKEAVRHLWEERDAVLPFLLADGARKLGKDSLRDILKAIVEITRQQPAWIALILRESSTPGPRLDWLIDNYLRDDINRGVEFIRAAQQLKLLPQVSPLQLLHLISGALSYNLLVAPMTEQATGINLASEESIDEQVDILLQLLSNQSA